MDDEISVTQQQFSIILKIPDEAFVYRQVHLNELDKDTHRFPKANHFKLRDADDALSVHWNRYANIQTVYCIIGLSYKQGKDQYKDINDYKVFKFPVSFVRSVQGIAALNHDPVFHGNPAPVGSPNNYAHSLVYYPDDEEIRIKLSNFCNKGVPNAFCEANLQSLESIVSELRQRLNSTPYHCCKSP